MLAPKKRFNFANGSPEGFEGGFLLADRNSKAMKDRIKEIMESKHMTQKVFAQFTGINEGTLSLLLRDKAQPTLKIYESIHRHFPDISMEWLFDGTGQMYNKDASDAVGGTSPADGSVAASVVGSAHPSSASSPSSPVSTPLFQESGMQGNGAASQGRNIEKTVVKYVDKPQRKITEIRVFFDDQTWESFVPKH